MPEEASRPHTANPGLPICGFWDGVEALHFLEVRDGDSTSRCEPEPEDSSMHIYHVPVPTGDPASPDLTLLVVWPVSSSPEGPTPEMAAPQLQHWPVWQGSAPSIYPAVCWWLLG